MTITKNFTTSEVAVSGSFDITQMPNLMLELLGKATLDAMKRQKERKEKDGETK